MNKTSYIVKRLLEGDSVRSVLEYSSDNTGVAFGDRKLQIDTGLKSDVERAIGDIVKACEKCMDLIKSVESKDKVLAADLAEIKDIDDLNELIKKLKDWQKSVEALSYKDFDKDTSTPRNLTL